MENNARYAVADQCDKYVECTDGEPEEKLCDDGLLFNDKAGIYTFPCQYPIDVNCTTRARTQPAQVCILFILLSRHNSRIPVDPATMTHLIYNIFELSKQY